MGRVLFVASWSYLGGGHRKLLDVAEHLSQHGYTCAAALPGPGPVGSRWEALGFEKFDYALPSLPTGNKTLTSRARFLAGLPASAASLTAAGRRFGARALYCDGGRPLLAVMLAAHRLRIPVLCSVQLIYRNAERRVLSWCFTRQRLAAVMFCSTPAAEPFRSLGVKATIVMNWVSPVFLEAPLPNRERGDSVVVGILGRISPTKGQSLFVEALTPLLADHPHLRLAIGGAADFEDPHDEMKLRRLVEQSGHADRIAMPGAVDALPFLDALDVLVVPSLWEEPFGVVAVEGMARMLPVVATRSGALPEIVADRETGFVVEPEAAELRTAVSRLVASAQLRHDLGVAGRRRVEEHFAPERQLRTVTRIVERALTP